MGQSFQLVAPRAKLAVSWRGKLGEILFDGSAKGLVHLLAVPVRRQHDSPQNSSVDSNNTPCEEKQGAKRSRDDDNAHAESPRCRKQIKIQAQNEKTVSNTAVAISDLPLELHRLIISSIDIQDVVCLSMTNQYFLSIGRECLEDYYTSHFGRWAGTNVVCVGEDIKPNDYPPGLFSNEELEVLRQKTIDIPYDWEYPDEIAFPTEQFRLEHFTYPTVSMIEEPDLGLFHITCHLKGSCSDRGISKDPAYSHMRPLIWVTKEAYFPTDQKWILRNLTTKQIVHSDAIALSPDYISGPDIQVLGFGEVVMSRICWSTSSCVSMADTTNISRGVWAGHCFDITTLSRHKVETRGEEWRDVSEEVAKEIASIWEGEYGANWREIICKSRRY